MEINFSSQVIFLPLSMSFGYLKLCPSLYFLPVSASHFLLFPFLFLSCLRLSFYLSVSIPQRLSLSSPAFATLSLFSSSFSLSWIHLPRFIPLAPPSLSPSLSVHIFLSVSLSACPSLPVSLSYFRLYKFVYPRYNVSNVGKGPKNKKRGGRGSANEMQWKGEEGEDDEQLTSVENLQNLRCVNENGRKCNSVRMRVRCVRIRMGLISMKRITEKMSIRRGNSSAAEKCRHTQRPTHKHKHHPIFVYTRTKAHEYANTQKH